MALHYAMQQPGPAQTEAVHHRPPPLQGAGRLSWRDVRVLVIDTETTGVDVTEDRVVELGAAYLEQGQQREIRRMRLNPQRPIPREASAIHGIYDEHVRHKPTFPQVAARFVLHLDGTALGGPPPFLSGYNARSFDVPVLNAELARAGLSHRIQSDEVLDLMIFVRWHHRDLRRRSLECVCQHYGIPLRNAHSAAADASATGTLLFSMIDAGLVPDSVEAALCEQARMGRVLEEEWKRYQYWLYADRKDGRLRLGAGRNCGTYLDEVSADYLEYLLRDIPDLPQEVRTIFRSRLPS